MSEPGGRVRPSLTDLVGTPSAVCRTLAIESSLRPLMVALGALVPAHGFYFVVDDMAAR